MSGLSELISKHLTLKLSGEKIFNGILIDYASDIAVLYDGVNYMYIPWLHVHYFYPSDSLNGEIIVPAEPTLAEELEKISYRKILLNAKGVFVEIYVTGNVSFHGYVTNVLNDYIVFYSPIFKTMYISLAHLKWLIPYNQTKNPYALPSESLPVQPINISVHRSFEEQLKKEVGKLIVIDGGTDQMKIGVLKKVEDSRIELNIATGEKIYIRLSHIKSVHLP